jgi:hypothetical protein
MASAVLAATTLVVAACSSSGGGYGDDDDTPTPAANTAPTISAITDRSSDQDTEVGPIEFGLTDSESAAGDLTLTAVADGPGLFPADGIVLAGSGATRSLKLVPLEAATGVAVITVTARDPQGLTATRTFRVAVNPRTASIRDATVSTFAKAETDDATAVNGFTFTQDADDPAIFEPLIGVE